MDEAPTDALGPAVHPIDPPEAAGSGFPSPIGGGVPPAAAGRGDDNQPRRRPVAAGLAVVALFAAVVAIARPTDVAAPTSTLPTGLDVRLPVAVPDATEPRPASPGLASSPDWEALDPGPLQPGITPWEPVWTGDEIVFQRVSGELVAYDPDTRRWRELAPPPVHVVGEDVSALWAGDEMVVWAREGATAWDPETARWRRPIDDWPLDPTASATAVWTGEEIVDVAAGIAVDPVTGASRELAPGPRPAIEERASAVWAGGVVVVVPQGAVYDPVAGAWLEGGASGLTPLAADAVWTGAEVFGADYEMRAAAFDPGTGAWTVRPEVPLRFSECAPTLHELGGRALVAHCSGLALWDPAGSRWLPIALPGLSAEDVVSTGDELYAVTGYGVYRLVSEVLDRGPRRLAVGAGVLDLPTGWSVGGVETGTTGEGLAAQHGVTITLAGPAGGCVVRATHADPGTVIGRFLVPGHEIEVFDLVVGGEPVEAVSVPAGAGDELHHLAWAIGSSDTVEVACRDAGATAEIARNVWSPWQAPD